MLAGSLEIELLANMARLNADMTQARQAVGSAMSSIEKSVAFAKTALIGLGAVGLVAAFAGNVRASIDLADHLNKLAQRTGIATEQLSQLQYAAKMADVSNDSLATGIKKLNVSIAGGLSGDKEKVALFKQLGITLTDTSGRVKSTDTVLLEMAESFSKMNAGAVKTTTALGLLGKAGDEMIPFLNGGAQAIRNLMAEADKLGLTISSDFAASAEEFNDNLTRVQAQSQKLSILFAGDFVAGLGKAMKAMADATVEGGRLAGIMAGLNTLIYGDDRHMASVSIVEGTERVLAAEAALDKARARGNEKEVARLTNAVRMPKEEVAVHVNYAKMLDADQERAAAAAKKLQEAKSDPKAVKTASSTESEAAKIMKRVQEQLDLDTQSLAMGRDLTESERFRVKVLSDVAEAKGKISVAERASLDAMLASKDVQDAQILLNKSELTSAQAVSAERQKLRNADYDSVQRFFEGEREAVNARNKAMTDTLQGYANETAALTMTNEEREVAIKLIEIERLGLVKGTEAYEAYAEKVRTAVANKAAVQEGINLQVGMWQTVEDAARESFTSIGDSGKKALDRLRDTLRNGFYALLYEMTVKKWIVNIVTSVSGAGVAQQAFGATGGIGSLLGGSGGSGLGSLGGLKSIYDTITGGFTALGDSVAFAAEDIGAWLMQNTTGILNEAGGALMGNASSIGGMGSLAGGAMAGYGLGTAISGDFSAFGEGNGDVATVVGTAIGAIFGPLGAVLGGAIGGLVNRAFGMGKKEMVASGIRGTLSTDGANVQNFSRWKQKGGWFNDGASGEDLSAISSTLQGFLDTAIGLTVTSTQAYAAALGLSADTVLGYSQAINLELKDLDPAQQEAAIAAALSSFADGVANMYGGVYRLRKEGEGGSAALVRLSTSLVAVNAWLGMLGQNLLQASVSGGDAASKLADLFGGLDKLGAALNVYYQDFYGVSERTAARTAQMTMALKAVGLTLPRSKEGFRALADSLDLNTEAGRKAYATLIAIAPEFAAVADEMSKVADSMADRLLQTFSGRQRLIPLLASTLQAFDGLGSALADNAHAALDMTTAAGWISVQLGDVSSGILYFGGVMDDLDRPLDAAQLAAQALAGEIQLLSLNASGANIDFEGLNAALANVDTETFMATMQGVLSRVADLFADVLGNITSERIAIRDAAVHILNPGVMTKLQIQRSLQETTVALPSSNAGVVAAQANLAEVDAMIAANKAAIASAQAQPPSTAAMDAAAAAVAAANNRVANAQVGVNQFRAYGNKNFNMYMDMAYAGIDARGSLPNPSGEVNAQNVVFELLAAQAATAAPNANFAAQQAAYAQAMAAFEASVKPLQDYAQTLANVNLPAALQAAREAQAAYVAGLQNYAIDASKATEKLGRLREETMKYYEQQKQLADLMGNSARQLRATVEEYRFGRMDPQAQLASLQEQYSTAYSMAMSTSGSDLAGYGDKLNALLGPLLEKAGSVLTGSAYDAFAATSIARAEAIAARLDALTPTDYAADTLALLGQIDVTLAGLEAGTKSAEKIIAEAVTAGSEKTAAGLRAIIAALTNQSVPAFATGGDHIGGFRLVGERGPELESTGASRIFNASQTRSILQGGGNSSDVVAELRALRQDNSDMRAELRAVVTSNAKMLRIAEREEIDGKKIRTDRDTPIQTQVVA